MKEEISAETCVSVADGAGSRAAVLGSVLATSDIALAAASALWTLSGKTRAKLSKSTASEELAIRCQATSSGWAGVGAGSGGFGIAGCAGCKAAMRDRA